MPRDGEAGIAAFWSPNIHSLCGSLSPMLRPLPCDFGTGDVTPLHSFSGFGYCPGVLCRKDLNMEDSLVPYRLRKTDPWQLRHG